MCDLRRIFGCSIRCNVGRIVGYVTGVTAGTTAEKTSKARILIFSKCLTWMCKHTQFPSLSKWPLGIPLHVRPMSLLLAVLACSSVVYALPTVDQSEAPRESHDTSRLILSADRLVREGRAPDALALLQEALMLAENADMEQQLARIHLSLGRALFVLGELEPALTHLGKSLDLAEVSAQEELMALALNGLGNIASAKGRQQESLADYSEAMNIAEATGSTILAAEAATNAGRAALALKQRDRALEFADFADKALQSAPPERTSAHAHIALARLLRDLGQAQRRLAAYHHYQTASTIGTLLGDPTLHAYGLGYIGEMYEQEGRKEEALKYTGQALQATLGIERDDILYRLQWQAGRILRDLGREDEAITAYRQAVATIQNVRSRLMSSPLRRRLSFREFVGDLYYQLADLLLRRAGRVQISDAQADLLAARDTVEQLKAVELEDYFQDECVTALKEKKLSLDRKIDTHTAALYPIILQDRLELLLSLPDEIRRISVPVDANTLTQEARLLRQALETYRGTRYLVHARRLYDWLIRPWKEVLRERDIDTLVFLPDGALRLIPISTLHDGEHHLIEGFAIATSPGLILTDPKPIGRDSPQVLLSGLSEAVQGYSALPAVEAELEALQKLFGGRQIKDREFVKLRLKTELEQSPYSIVHIATHGEIESDVRKSYLLTYDDKLTMDELEDYVSRTRYRVEGVELLTLSACRTAVGDDRAALGLAGIALKAGARSAVATLWSISDEATSQLIPRFYEKLLKSGLSKAQALQQTQREMLESGRFSHPGYWAPYLLVGNWL